MKTLILSILALAAFSMIYICSLVLRLPPDEDLEDF